MPDDDKDIKEKVIDKVTEAGEDLLDELVEDLTDGKDNSANPWYKRWWNNWTKSVSVLAVIGGLGTFGLQFSTEWYKERKDKEYERITAIERQLEDLNRNIAVMNQVQKDMNESQKEVKMSKQAMWRAIRESSEVSNEVRIQGRINAILNERNYNDIKSAHAREGNGGQCQMHDGGHAKEEPKTDVKNMSEIQKIIKKRMGSAEEKDAIKKHEDKEAEEAKIQALLNEAKKSGHKENLDDYKNKFIDQQQQQQQQQEQRKR